jgi:hypothetical protein
MKKLSLLLGLLSFMLLLGMARATTYTCNSCLSCSAAIASHGVNGNIIKVSADFQPTYDGDLEQWECSSVGDIYGDGNVCIEAGATTGHNWVLDCDNHTVYCSGSSCSGCQAGLHFGLTSHNNITIKNCKFTGFHDALGIGADNYNLNFFNNVFNATTYLTTNPSYTSFLWNTTKTNGTNIVGGIQLGGNYWAKPNGSGYSETCVNNNNDSFCDSPYTFTGYIDFTYTDSLPLTLRMTGSGGDTTPPDISWNAPADGYVTQNSTALTFNVTSSETGGYSIININSTNYTASWSGNYSYYSLVGSNSTTYCAFFYINDSSGNSNISSTRCATINLTSFVDTTPPTITITSPTNVNYTTTTIALDVSADEPTDAWWYSLNGGANTTFTPNTTIAAAQGANDLFVYANDTTGNIGEAGVSFFVDSIAPDIAWNTPANNSVTQNTSFIFWNATLSETGTCELDLNSSLNITMDVNGLYCSYDFSGTNTTTYCGRVYATDIFGNMNLSSSRCVTINLSGTDTTPPNLTIISPVATTYTTSSVALTVSADEPINTWWYSLNGGANASFTPNTTISGLASGVYTLNVYANDNYGNEGFSSATFTVQVPVISNLGFFAPIAGIAIGGGFLLFILGMFFDEGAALARDPKKLATIAVGILIVAVLLSALFV